jgi:hypothetical protein
MMEVARVPWVKWVITVVLAAGGAVAIALGVLQAPSAHAAAERAPLKALELRPFPGAGAVVKASPQTAEDEPEPLHGPAADAGRAAPSADAGQRPVPPGPAAQPGLHPESAAARPAQPAPPAQGDGSLDLAASDTADIYLDGKKIGSSPMRGVKVRAGNHKVRFDCYDAAGNAVTGQVKVVPVVADQELEVTYPCPESQ